MGHQQMWLVDLEFDRLQRKWFQIQLHNLLILSRFMQATTVSFMEAVMRSDF